MEPSTFKRFREIVYERSGISLGPGKEALVSARVGKRMRALNIEDHKNYLRYVMDDETGEEVVHLIDAISTNVTSFFREPEHFTLMDRVFSEWINKGQRRFRFWSAASSTGEEPYSLAITLLDAMSRQSLPLSAFDVRILATDISTRVLDKCQKGVYKQDRLDTVPAALRDRYFERQRDQDDVHYAVKPVLRKMITFSRLNLSDPPFPMQGPFDAVFCRNVMIYFDNTVRGNLLAEVHRLLRQGGYLLVGHAESLTGMMSTFRTVQPSTYLKE
jgi:chemotaxis protein methyltransferase CheR